MTESRHAEDRRHEPNRPAIPLCLLLVACARDQPQEVLGTVERDRLELIAESNERIVEIAVREGEHVAAGAVLVRQEAGLAQPRIDQARAAQAEAQRRLADLEAGPRQREIEESRASLAGAEGALRTDQAEFERVRTLVEARLLSARTSTRRGRVATRRWQRAMPPGRVSPCCRRGRVRSRSRARALPSNVPRLRWPRSRRAPRATQSGTACGPGRSLPYKLGERPAAGKPVAVLLADGVPYARVYVPEPLRVTFLPGTKVDVHVDGVTGAVAGTVRYVAAEAAFTPYYSLTQKDRSRLAYLAEITLDGRARR